MSICSDLAAENVQLQQQIDGLENGGGGSGVVAQIHNLMQQIRDNEARANALECNIQPTEPNSPTLAAMTASGNVTVSAVVSADGTLFYQWWTLGGANGTWFKIPGAPKTDQPPALALVGDNHDFLFITVRDRATNTLMFNQGTLGSPFIGWSQVG